MAVLQEEQPIFIDLGGSDRAGARRFPPRVSDEEGIVEQRRAVDLPAGEGKRQQNAIELAPVQCLAGCRAGFLAEIELELRPLVSEPREHGRKKERSDCRDHTYAELAMQRTALSACHLGEFLDLAENDDGLAGDLFA